MRQGELPEMWRTKYHTSYHTISDKRRKRTSFRNFGVLWSMNLQIIGFWKPILFNPYGQNIHPRQKGLHGAKVLIENLPRCSDTRGQ